MKTNKPWSLKTQLATAMVGSVLLSILFGYVGLTLLGRWQEQEFFATMPTEVKQVEEKIKNGVVPTEKEVKLAMRWASEAEAQGDFESNQERLLILLSLIAMTVSLGVGLGIARATVRPIEEIGTTARAVAKGDLSARVKAAQNAPSELKMLLSDFNAMADALEAFDREARESSAAIAHELRTPLTILRSRLQAHYDGVFAWTPADAKLLIGQVNALAHIIDDLQIVSLGATGQLALQVAPHDVAILMAPLLDTLRPSYALEGLTIEANLQSAFACVDPRRLPQAVLALIENGRCHGGAGRVIRVETAAEANETVIRVRDFGPGLPYGQEYKVFERFWRADPSRDRVSGGSGLGLSVVASLVKAQGGTAKALNHADGGAVFELRFKALRKSGAQ
jgi:signal transduction histidine kinase